MYQSEAETIILVAFIVGFLKGLYDGLRGRK